MAVIDELVAILGFEYKGDGDAKRFNSAMDRMENRANGFGRALRRLGAAALGYFSVRAIADQVEKSITAAVGFENATAELRKTFTGTNEELQAVQETAFELARAFPSSQEAILGIAAAASQAGVPVDELSGYMEKVTEAATAFGIPADQLATSMFKFRNVFGFTVDQLADFNDGINLLSNNMPVTADELVNFANRAAGTVGALGGTTEALQAVGAALISVGAIPETAARGYTYFATQLNKSGPKVKKALEALGTSTEEYRKAQEEGGEASDAYMERLLTLYAEMETGEERAEVGAALFGEFAREFDKLDPALLAQAFGLAADDMARFGSVSAETANFLDTAEARWQRLGNVLREVRIRAATPLIDKFSKLADVALAVSQDVAKGIPFLESLAFTLQDFGMEPGAVDAVIGFLSGVSTAVSGYASTVGPAAAQLGELAGAMGRMMGLMASGGDGEHPIIDFLQKLSGISLDAVSGQITATATALTQLVEALNSLLEGDAGGAVDTALGGLGKLGEQTVKSGGGNPFTAIGNALVDEMTEKLIEDAKARGPVDRAAKAAEATAARREADDASMAGAGLGFDVPEGYPGPAAPAPEDPRSWWQRTMPGFLGGQDAPIPIPLPVTGADGEADVEGGAGGDTLGAIAAGNDAIAAGIAAIPAAISTDMPQGDTIIQNAMEQINQFQVDVANQAHVSAPVTVNANITNVGAQAVGQAAANGARQGAQAGVAALAGG